MPIQKWSDDIWIAKLATDPVFSEDMDELNRLAGFQDLDANLVFDLTGVDHVNSSNLSQLLHLRKQMQGTGRKMRLVAPQSHVWAVFLAAQLDRLFECSPDTMTALAEIQMDQTDAGSSVE